jgi:hypothetical protein
MTRRAAPALAIAVLLCGCEVGPDFKRPVAPQLSGYTLEGLPVATLSADTHGGEAQRFRRRA